MGALLATFSDELDDKEGAERDGASSPMAVRMTAPLAPVPS